MKSRTYLPILFIVISFAPIDNIFGQGIPSGGGSGGSDRIEGKTKFLPIPYVGYDRALGFSVGAIPMLMFNPIDKDTLSPSSIVGAAGIYAENKTWFLMGFGSFHFKEDKWRTKIAGGTGEINYQFFIDSPIEIWVPYNTNANFFYVGLERKVIDKIYAGINYTYMEYITSTELLPVVDTSNIYGLGFNLSMDRRSNYYYPRSGYKTSLSYNTRPEWIGNKDVSDKIEFDFNIYNPGRNNKDVIAARAFVGLGIGDLTFNDQFIVGRNDIRGYSQGEYRGNYLVSLQGEYRWNFHQRMGAVGFVGAATVFESINEDYNGKILPGIGAGFRFVASKDTHFSVGLDVAKGIGDWSLSFMIGEAF